MLYDYLSLPILPSHHFTMANSAPRQGLAHSEIESWDGSMAEGWKMAGWIHASKLPYSRSEGELPLQCTWVGVMYAHVDGGNVWFHRIADFSELPPGSYPKATA